MKTTLLTILVATASLVFLGVQELSRASTQDLDQAISSDLGTLGSYRVDIGTGLGLTPSQALGLVHQAVDPLQPASVQLAVQLPALHPECPPYRELGTLTVAVLIESDGNAAPFRNAEELPVTSDLCLAGLVIPKDALREPTQEEAKLYEANIFLDPAYAQEARLTSTEPVRYQIGIITHRADDETDAIADNLRQAFASVAATAGVTSDDATSVRRTDDGFQVRSASSGIKLVYALISWGVLLISGLGLLVAELIVLRDRNWFFGLARAVGARKRSIAGLIALDIVVVLVVGLGAAVLIGVVAAPVINDFGQAAFKTSLVLIRPSGLAALAAGAAAMLVLGAAYPAWRATRLDPLEVLERR